MTSPFTQINHRTIRRDRRRSMARITAQVFPWLCTGMVLLILADMALKTAVAIHPLTEQAEALRGM